MINERCYGILDDYFYEYHNIEDLELRIEKAIQNGANAFILYLNSDFSKKALDICRQFRKKSKNRITIKIILDDINIIKNPEDDENKKILKNIVKSKLFILIRAI